MIELLITNAVYVAYRLVVSAPLVKFATRYMPYYVAVILMAQLSFVYDNLNFYFYFNNSEFNFLDLLFADIAYTARVIAAWFVIKQLWDWIGNYWVAVFMGAELTFVVDYFIFGYVY